MCMCQGKRLCRNCLPSSSGCCSNMKQISITTDLDNILDNTRPPPDANQRVMTALPKSHSESRNEANMNNTEVNGSFKQLSNPNNAIILPPPPPPPHVPSASPSFIWGDYDSVPFMHALEDAYTEIAHWRKNVFSVPYGNAGKVL